MAYRFVSQVYSKDAALESLDAAQDAAVKVQAAGGFAAFEAMVHDLRALLRLASGRTPDPSAVILDSRTLRSSPESGHRAGYDGAKRKKGSKVHAAVDTLGHLLALHVTPASEQDQAQVEELAEAVQEATGESVELAYVDQGYTGEEPAEAAEEHGIRLEVVKRPEAKRGFVLPPAAAPLLFCLSQSPTRVPPSPQRKRWVR